MRVLFLLSCVILLLLSSCKSLKQVQEEIEMFQPKLDSTTKIVYKDLTIKPYDHLRIQVYTEATANQEQTMIFNLPGNSTSTVNSITGTNTNLNSGGLYDVDKDSTIDYPKLGRVHVVGLTSKQLKDTLSILLSPYVKLPRLIVNLVNIPIYSFNLATGSKIVFNEEKITVLDYLSKSGVSTNNKLDNILVVREDSGTHHYYNIDIRSATSLYNSPVYQLQQNDLVYLHPTKTRLRQARNGDNTTAITDFTSIMGSISNILSPIFLILALKNLFN
jgi:polysaccharide export outer membrane protein